MKNIVLIFTVCSILLLSACGSSKQVVVSPEKLTPTWYSSPLKSNASTLYATGDGASKEEAIANALSMMISTLSVSIESTFSSKVVSHEGRNNSYQAVHTNEVSSKVKTISITNYELIHEKSMGFRKYIVLLKTDKKQLFDSLQREVQQKFLAADKRHAEAKKLNAIQELQEYKKTREKLSEIENSLNIMKVLNNSFDTKKALNRLLEFNMQADKLRSKISFSVSTNRDAIKLKEVIQSAINSQNIELKNAQGKYHFRVKINSKIEIAKSYGFTLARSAISITTKDYKGNIIGSNKLNITGQSTQGLEIAKESVAIKLNAMIEKDGISKVIGLEI